MIKAHLTAAVLAALVATPAMAQQTDGGALDTQETQMPATGATDEPAETQIPAAQPGASDSQLPADQSGQPLDSTGQPSETQLPADQQAPASDSGTMSEPSNSMSQPADTQEATVPATGPQAGELDQSTVMQVQDALDQQGFDPGPTDGLMGPQTASALRQFQQAQGIEATGQADQQTLAALGVSEGGQAQPQQQQQQEQQQEQAPSQP